VSVLVFDIGHGFHVEAQRAPGLAQQVDIAAALVAEAEVFAHKQPAGCKAAHQQLLDEVFSGHVRQCLIEALEYDLTGTVSRKIAQLVAQAA